MIAASTDPLIGGKYSFVDQAVAPGQVYYYELEDVDINGNGSRFGPIQVTAEYNGRYELISAAILGLTGMTGVYYTRKMAIEQKLRAV